MATKATTVEAYLDELPEERREVLAAVRDLVNKKLPKGYRESFSSGMISWWVPLEDYPKTYNKQPLMYAALAAQKNYYALYLMNAYAGDQEQALREGFANAGKKLDMGKSCVRFKKLEDLPLEVIGKVVASTPPKKFIQQYEAARAK